MIRDIVLWNSQPWYKQATSLQIIDSDGVVVVNWAPPDSVNGRLFHWDGRQVFETGQNLAVVAGDGSWSVRVSGYTLTLP